MHQSEEKPTNVRLIGGILAIALMAGGYYLYGAYGPGAGLEHTAETERRLLEQSPLVFGTLRARFPETYGAFIRQIHDLVEQGADRATITQHTLTFMAEFRRENREILMRSHPNDIKAVVQQSRDIHEQVRAELGKTICNTFAVEGPASLGVRFDSYREEIASQDAALIDAMANARTRPPYAAVEPATPEDWDLAMNLMATTVGTEADRDALKTLSADADLCQSLVRMLDTLQSMDNETGERLRASYVSDLAQN